MDIANSLTEDFVPSGSKTSSASKNTGEFIFPNT